MKKKGICKRLQKSGSTSEGLKINDQLEFDVMIVVNGENIRISNIVEYPGYAHLKLKQPSKEKKKDNVQRFMDSHDIYISPAIFMREYFDEMKNILSIEENERLNMEIEMKKIGPSVCLIFKQDNGDTWFKADIVPTIEIEKNGKST